jgi:hypothetical protein
MKIGLMAVALVGMLGSGAAMAEVAHDGNYLLANCTVMKRYLDGTTTFTGGENVDAGMCAGIVEATKSMMYIMETLIDKNRRTCFPEKGIGDAQAIRIVLKYLNDHPADLHQDQTYLAFMAFRDAYRCK